MSSVTDVGRIVLPYFDPNTGDKGWQFGFPPDDSPFSGDTVKIRAFINETMQTHRKIIYYHGTEDQRGTPEWAWIHAENPEGSPETQVGEGPLAFVRLEAPAHSQGSVPLGDIGEARQPAVIYTQAGIKHLPYASLTYADYPFDIQVRSTSDRTLNLFSVGFAGINVAICAEYNGQLLAVWPTPAAYTLRLWTSHIARILYLSETVEGSIVSNLELSSLARQDTELAQHVFHRLSRTNIVDC